MNSNIKYTPEEIFAMFKEEHRLCSPLDFMANPHYVLTPKSLVWEWRDCRHMLDWEDLSDYFNQRFAIKLTRNEWRTCFEPEDERTIMDVCRKIAVVAKKPVIPLRKLLGQECRSASVFLSLKENLRHKGVNVSGIRPSTILSPYLVKYFSPMLEEILGMGVHVIDKLDYSSIRVKKKQLNWFEKLFSLRTKKVEVFYTGHVITFGDAVKRICEGQKLSTE